MKTHGFKVRRLHGAKLIPYLWQRQCWFAVKPILDDAVEIFVEKQDQEWLGATVKKVEGR